MLKHFLSNFEDKLNNINKVKSMNTCSQMELENFAKSFKIIFQKSPKMTKNVETFESPFFIKNILKSL